MIHGGDSRAEAPGVAAQCRGLMRDLERLAVRCTAEVKP